MDRPRDGARDFNLHHHPHAPYNRNLTLPPLPGPAFQSPFPPLLAQRPAPYNAHLHPVPSPSQLEPIHPPPSSNWRRDDKREFPPVESGNGSGYTSYNGYPARRETYADSRSSSSRVVPSVPDVPKDVDDNMPPTSDFVKKLYKMLEDPQFSHVVTWGPQGDCFVVKDVTEFTKSILPRMFKHSNFASFVRQLNKYDFHKLKNAEAEAGGMGYGDQCSFAQSWTFKHPDFRADDRDALENIKRKVPAARKSRGGAAPAPTPATPVQPTGTKTEATSPAPEVAASPSGSGSDPTRESDTIRMLLAQVEAMRANQEATRRAHEEQIEGLRQTAEDMSAHIRNLETNYQNVLGEIVHFQRNMANQDNLMQNLIGYFIGMENKKNSAGTGNTPPPDGDPQHQFMSGADASKIFDLGPQDVARASFEQMNEISRRAERSGMSFTDNSGIANPGGAVSGMSGNMSGGSMGSGGAGGMNSSAAGSMNSGTAGPMGSGVGGAMNPAVSGATMIGGKPVQSMTREEVLGRVEDLQRERPDQQPFTHSNFLPMLNSQMFEQQRKEEESHKGLQVITLGHLVPRDGSQNQQGGGMGGGMEYQQGQHHPQSQQQQAQQQQMGHPQDMSYTPPANYHGPTPASTSGAGPSAAPGGGGKSLRVRRSTYVPGWAVPPRVLLVDDDAVNLRLSKKFLQVFGCMIDVAVDGVGAVDKMNLEKYDLVLMDIVMPKMDGVSATSLIRRFDHMTPIISMTSNSKPNEIMTYYSSGMNDILPKPFSKEGLFEMLEKHLMHLKQIHQLGQFPRGVSIPPMNDAHMLDYMHHHENAESSGGASSSKHAVGFPNGTKTPNGVFNGFGTYEDDGSDPAKVSPFAALGLTEESYQMIMGDMMTQDGSGFFGDPGMDGGGGRGKRGMEDDGEDGGGKRPRFEEVVD
ncbi:kinase-regulated stress-responsive transcription factor skn7 [Ceratobasidium sp. 414]|nr:kinase-regulated stress-responsive transcription factor skn7 [Ceratobasidium sp. 414]